MTRQSFVQFAFMACRLLLNRRRRRRPRLRRIDQNPLPALCADHPGGARRDRSAKAASIDLVWSCQLSRGARRRRTQPAAGSLPRTWRGGSQAAVAENAVSIAGSRTRQSRRLVISALRSGAIRYQKQEEAIRQAFDRFRPRPATRKQEDHRYLASPQRRQSNSRQNTPSRR